MAPKAHHIHSKLASPSTGLPSWQGDPDDTGPLASLDTQHRAKQDRKGANGPPGQPRSNPMAVMPG